ncbi:MAG: histidine kinase, partial [Candidatus Rokuibacteriota bacterium]
MNRFIEKVHDIIAHARTMAAGSALATGQLSSAAEHLAAGSHEQAAGLEEAAASIEQIAAT